MHKYGNRGPAVLQTGVAEHTCATQLRTVRSRQDEDRQSKVSPISLIDVCSYKEV